MNPFVKKIDAILPQTQCGQCGYPACKPYAIAIAEGDADINQCPPGGNEGVARLAELLGVDTKPLNGDHGAPKPKARAVIDETVCIGCALCIEVCPVDAILGAAKHLHTVIAQECTGCELCILPCPVDCIQMQVVQSDRGTPIPCDLFDLSQHWASQRQQQQADKARERYEFRQQRLEREKKARAQRLAAKTRGAKTRAGANPQA